MCHIQRSCGYALRPTLTIAEIATIVAAIRSADPDVIITVDNCYGEFTEACEPTAVGADLVMGSLIKNPGGSLATGVPLGCAGTSDSSFTDEGLQVALTAATQMGVCRWWLRGGAAQPSGRSCSHCALPGRRRHLRAALWAEGSAPPSRCALKRRGWALSGTAAVSNFLRSGLCSGKFRTSPWRVGLWQAPGHVGEALKGGRLLAAVLAAAGFAPVPMDTVQERPSFITAIPLGSRTAMDAFCKAVQQHSPVGSYILPEAGALGGRACQKAVEHAGRWQ